jgi:carbon monoxide dehydrogenase subunit G
LNISGIKIPAWQNIVPTHPAGAGGGPSEGGIPLMEMTGSYRIAAPRDEVWAALNDPAVLKDCIPGCESLDKLSDTEMQAVASMKIGPVKARFSGKVTLSDLKPPESYTISG